jgi:hypothetical protein
MSTICHHSYEARQRLDRFGHGLPATWLHSVLNWFAKASALLDLLPMTCTAASWAKSSES